MKTVYVKIKDKKHAEKVIKRLVRIGYREYISFFPIPRSHVKTIAVYSDGDYQLLSREDSNAIKPKDIINSEPVKYFMEHNHV